MKKILIILCLVLLCSCGNKNIDNNANDTYIDTTYKNVSNYNNNISTLENYKEESNGNRENSSSLVKEDHKILDYTISNMTITSDKDDKESATIKFDFTNGSSEDLKNTSAVITFIENDGTENIVYVSINSAKSNETVSLSLSMKYRVINAKDYKYEIKEINGVG